MKFFFGKKYFLLAAVSCAFMAIQAESNKSCCVKKSDCVRECSDDGLNRSATRAPVDTPSSLNTPNTTIKRDGSGNFAAGTITANLQGNAATATLAKTATNAATAVNFSGKLSGDVVGVQGGTVVTAIGGQTAGAIAKLASLVNGATATNKANSLVLRDGSGNFSAGTITGSVSGNASGFTGSLSGDVTGKQSATVVASVGGKTAASVASTVSLVSTATTANIPNTLVKRDSNGGFGLGDNLTASTISTSFSPGSGTGMPFNIGLSNPSAFRFSPNNQFVSILNRGGEEGGYVSVYALNNSNGSISEVSGSPFFAVNMINPNAIMYSPNGKFLAVSTPAVNSKITMFAVNNSNGALTEISGSPFTTGSQCIDLKFSDNGKFLVALLSGSSKVAVFSVNTSTGALAEISGSPFNVSSPSNMQFSGDGNYLAIASTGTDKIFIFSFNKKTGSLSEIEASPYSLNNVNGNGNDVYPAYLSYSPNGKFLATANVSDYSINVFTVNQQTGELTFLERHFAYLPQQLAYSKDSKYLITSALGQPPHGYITMYSVNQQTGALTAVPNYAFYEINIYPYRLSFSNNGNFLGVLSTYEGKFTIIKGLGAQVSMGNSIGVGGNLSLSSTDEDGGAVTVNGNRFMHNYGINNTFVGQNSGVVPNTGTDNVGCGANSLSSCSSGSNNIAIGADAGVSLVSGSNNIYIGADAGSASEANTIRIGSSMSKCCVSGVSGSAVTDGSAVYVDSSGKLGIVISSEKYKENIVKMGDVTNLLMSLDPVTFRYNQDIDPEGKVQWGLIAEQVARVFPDLVIYDQDGQPKTVAYHLLIPMLLNQYQQHEQRLVQLEQQMQMVSAY